MSVISLPHAPSPEILKRLIRARQLLEHAKLHASSGGEIDHMIATHGADNAIEWTLKVIADHIEYEAVSGNSLPESELAQLAGVLSKHLKDVHGTILPYYQEIKALRQMRNLVQHGGFTPGAEMQKQMTIADRFFAKVCDRVFGLQPDQVRISGVVQDATVQAHLRSAEAARDARRFEDCVRACRNAYEEASFRYRSDSQIALSEIPALVELDAAGRSVAQHLALLSEMVDALRMKVDPARMDRFSRIIGHLPEPGGVYSLMQRPWEARDADFCYGFVSETILRWQSDSFPPLYAVEDTDHRLSQSINGVDLPSGEIACSYHLKESQETLLVFAREGTRAAIEGGLEVGPTYRYRLEHYEGGSLIAEIDCDVVLGALQIGDIVTHDPQRWKVMLSWSTVPLTWHRKEFKDGEIVGESPSLRTCTREELLDLHPIDEAAADLVLAHRDQGGELAGESIRQIGLTDEQARWIESFTRR